MSSTTDARARLDAYMVHESDVEQAEFTARVDAVVAAETATLQARIAELEAFAYGCDGEGCSLPHSSWCGVAQQTAAENGGCTCPQPWKGTPQPHAGYCWLVSPPKSEVDEMRKRIAELSQQRDDLLVDTVTMLDVPDDTPQQWRDRAEKAEARIAASLAWHVKFPDSEHCQHDSEPWPCPTVKALQP